MMKIIALIITLFVPVALFAHAGHGISGNEILHLMMSHYYIFIVAAIIAFASYKVYRRKAVDK